MEHFMIEITSMLKKMSAQPASTNTSTEITEINLDDDLLAEILIRLPLKSLFSFKCVCKSWYNLISDDYLLRRLPLIKSAIFYHCNANSHSKEPRYACTASGNGLTNCNFDFFPCQQKSSIIDCCNGLVLCYSSFPSIAFYVINPTIRKWITLPKCSKRSQLSILAFDPCYSSEFRVISFTGWLRHGAELEVFSSITGNWVEYQVQWGLSTDAMSATMRYFDTTLYILGYPKYVVCINVASMICHQLELPEIAQNEGNLAKCSDRLHYIHSDGDEQLRIWMLTSTSKNEWILKHSINVRAIIGLWGPKTSFWTRRSQHLALNKVKFLSLHPMKEVAYLCLPGKIVSYDLNKKRIEELYVFGKEREKDHLVQIWLFPFSRYLKDCLSNMKW